MSRKSIIAKDYCANWWSGKCQGVMLARKEGRIVTWIDSKLAGKDCVADTGCDYFENIVIPSISNEEPGKRKRI
jgi:hypothetical protein